MSNKQKSPRGRQINTVLALPADTNANGDIFGGWILYQIDMAAGVACTRIAGAPIATVAIDKVIFKTPVLVGDTVSFHVELLKVGNSSMQTRVEVWVERGNDKAPSLMVTEAIVTCVALNKSGRPRPVKKD